MAGPGPGRQHEQQPRIGPRADLVALAGLEDREEPRAAADRVAAVGPDLDLALDHDELRALMDLVLLERLARRQTQGDRARLTALRVEDLRAEVRE